MKYFRWTSTWFSKTCTALYVMESTGVLFSDKDFWKYLFWYKIARAAYATNEVPNYKILGNTPKDRGKGKESDWNTWPLLVQMFHKEFDDVLKWMRVYITVKHLKDKQQNIFMKLINGFIFVLYILSSIKMECSQPIYFTTSNISIFNTKLARHHGALLQF